MVRKYGLKSDLVAEIEIVAETGRRQPKYGDSRPDVARNQKARGRKKQRNGGGPVPIACEARQHHCKGGAGHRHLANRRGDFLIVHPLTLERPSGVLRLDISSQGNPQPIQIVDSRTDSGGRSRGRAEEAPRGRANCPLDLLKLTDRTVDIFRPGL